MPRPSPTYARSALPPGNPYRPTMELPPPTAPVPPRNQRVSALTVHDHHPPPSTQLSQRPAAAFASPSSPPLPVLAITSRRCLGTLHLPAPATPLLATASTCHPPTPATPRALHAHQTLPTCRACALIFAAVAGSAAAAGGTTPLAKCLRSSADSGTPRVSHSRAARSRVVPPHLRPSEDSASFSRSAPTKGQEDALQTSPLGGGLWINCHRGMCLGVSCLFACHLPSAVMHSRSPGPNGRPSAHRGSLEVLSDIEPCHSRVFHRWPSTLCTPGADDARCTGR